MAALLLGIVVGALLRRIMTEYDRALRTRLEGDPWD